MKEIRLYLCQGSCWVVLLAPVKWGKLDVDALLRCLEDFVAPRRASSAAWVFAQKPQAVPAFDPLDIYNLVCLVEGLRAELELPKLCKDYVHFLTYNFSSTHFSIP